MKLKNKEIKSVYNALFSIGNRVADITQRWNVALMSQPYMEVNNIITMEVNKIIEEQGVEENGKKSLPLNNADYIALMECETEIDVMLIPLSELQQLYPSIDELIALKSVILAKECEE